MTSRGLSAAMKLERNFRIALLLTLYILQGIPMGLAASVPLLLQSKGASYKEQAAFSLVSSPYSMKLLWAPLVDSLFWRKVGRRRSWIIPIQFIVALIFFFTAPEMGSLLDDVGGSGPVMAGASLTEPEKLLRQMEDGSSPRGGDVSGVTASNVGVLTAVFFLLYFLVATQDIAVDGWALSLLPKDIVGYASITNTIGQTLGFFLSYTIFLALHSADFCNRYIRSPENVSPIPILPTASYIRICGFAFFVVTSIVALFVREDGSISPRLSGGSRLGKLQTPPGPSGAVTDSAGWRRKTPLQHGANLIARGKKDERSDIEAAFERRHSSPPSPSASDEGDEQELSRDDDEDVGGDRELADEKSGWEAVKAAYKEAGLVLRLKRVLQLCCLLLTARMAFGAVDGATSLRLVEAGIPKEHLAAMAVAAIPVELALPVFLARVTSGPAPLRAWRRAYLARIFAALLSGVVVTHLSQIGRESGGQTWQSYVVAFLSLVLYRSVSVTMFVIQMAFFAKISDPRIGGTFMTLLNTFANMGAWWPNPVSLYFLDVFSSRQCVPSPNGTSTAAQFTVSSSELAGVSCRSPSGPADCSALGGSCEVVSDGYLMLVIVGFVVGLAWLFFVRPIVRKIEEANEEEWRVQTSLPS